MNSLKYIYLLPVVLLLSGCMYAETPEGRVAVVDLPVHNTTTINKTVRIIAPPGTTVVYGESAPYHYVRDPYPQTYPARLPLYAANGNCLDGRRATPSSLQTAPCNGMAYQDFAFMHNTLQTLGQCVSVSSGRFSSRSRISLVACNGSIEQQWFADGQRIRSMLNGQCLDASKTGSAVRLQSCDDSIGQQFGRHH